MDHLTTKKRNAHIWLLHKKRHMYDLGNHIFRCHDMPNIERRINYLVRKICKVFQFAR